MKTLGYALICVAFFAGSWTTVVDPETVEWSWFGAALLLGVVGTFIVRRGAQAEERDPELMDRNWSALRDSLEQIEQRSEELAQKRTEIPTYDVHGEIDRLFPEHLSTFVQARQTIAHRAGLKAYADVMSEFAAGERYLNRSWSASVDGYADEVEACLLLANEQFRSARRKFSALADAA